MADPKDGSLFDSVKGSFMMLGGLLFLLGAYVAQTEKPPGVVKTIMVPLSYLFGLLILYLGGRQFIEPITAVGEQGNANRSVLILIGLFLLILVVVVFGIILAIKK